MCYWPCLSAHDVVGNNHQKLPGADRQLITAAGMNTHPVMRSKQESVGEAIPFTACSMHDKVIVVAVISSSVDLFAQLCPHRHQPVLPSADAYYVSPGSRKCRQTTGRRYSVHAGST
jgi:hypothetical protein